MPQAREPSQGRRQWPRQIPESQAQVYNPRGISAHLDPHKVFQGRIMQPCPER